MIAGKGKQYARSCLSVASAGVQVEGPRAAARGRSAEHRERSLMSRSKSEEAAEACGVIAMVDMSGDKIRRG